MKKKGNKLKENLIDSDFSVMGQCAINLLMTKLDIINAELSVALERNVIQMKTGRIKTYKSTCKKLNKKGLEKSFSTALEKINDLIGVRAVCPYVDDLYLILKHLEAQTDIRLLKVKDYIKTPKESGYQSLHLILEVPIVFQGGTQYLKTELQLRTPAMDYWANLDHQLRYKKEDTTENNREEAASIDEELRQCAEVVTYLDQKMLEIRKKLKAFKSRMIKQQRRRFMLREIDLTSISDGKLYRQSDMVKAGCNDCKGCSDCCREMGTSIILDPYDLYHLCRNLDQSFEQLLSYAVELRVVDGIILPNLRMTGEEETCTFLNEQGRCSIHKFRPGFCRMFPLGRIYENNGFQYFLQVQECRQEPKTKVKISRWLDVPDIKRYETFINDWHYFLKKAETILEKFQDDASIKNISMYLLKTFYLTPYDVEAEFYPQFRARLEKAENYFF